MRVGSTRVNFQWHVIMKALSFIKQAKDVDLIHGTTFFGIIPSRLISKVSGIKSVLTVHEVYGRLWFLFAWRLGIINYTYEWLLINILRFDQYVCPSNYTKNCLRVAYGISDDKLRTVHLGLEYEFRDPEKCNTENMQALKKQYELEGKYIGLYFGRLGLAKGFDTVLQSVKDIIKQYPDYIQVFIAPKRQPASILGVKNTLSITEIEAYIKKHKLQDHVVWIDSVKRTDLRDFIWLSDLIILPTRAEWFGFAVSEVCAMNKQLITTNIASVPEVVYGKIGFVEPGNSADIVEKVADFRDGKYETIAEKKFLREDCVNKMEGIYSGLLKA